MTVVFEILSPSNTTTEVASKLAFYDEYGVEEYYTYNPFTNLLMVYIRKNGTLLREQVGSEFVSPRMRIRLRTTDSDLEVLFPDGSRFLPFEQVYEDRELERRRANQATAERDQATAERDRATAERDQVTAERDQATAERDQATAERDQVTAERDDAQARLARLIELGKKARQQTATPEELAELERLEDESLQ